MLNIASAVAALGFSVSLQMFGLKKQKDTGST